MNAHYVKIRERGQKAWWFVDQKGEGTRLRIHAARFESREDAAAFVEKYTSIEPDLEFKVSP